MKRDDLTGGSKLDIFANVLGATRLRRGWRDDGSVSRYPITSLNNWGKNATADNNTYAMAA